MQIQNADGESVFSECIESDSYDDQEAFQMKFHLSTTKGKYRIISKILVLLEGKIVDNSARS